MIKPGIVVRKDSATLKQHTSGHADIADLKRLVKALSPKRLVPIHSFACASSKPSPVTGMRASAHLAMGEARA